jgi:hypothetical protein
MLLAYRTGERESLLQLAEGYRLLADMKRMVLRKVN